MSARWTRAWVGGGAMVLALGSWMVSGAGADDPTATPAPGTLPPAAFLNGEAAPHAAQVEGIEVSVRAVEAGYELTLVNPTDQSRTLRWQIECSEVRGSPIARMGPIPRQVHDEVAQLAVAARGRAVHLVRVAHPEPPRGQPPFGESVSMRIELRPAAAGTPPNAVAVLAVPVTA